MVNSDPQSKVHNESERRQATILFADISGFTSMSEKMDPELVTSTMNECFCTDAGALLGELAPGPEWRKRGAELYAELGISWSA
jgi:hypothetical protein